MADQKAPAPKVETKEVKEPTPEEEAKAAEKVPTKFEATVTNVGDNFFNLKVENPDQYIVDQYQVVKVVILLDAEEAEAEAEEK